MTSSQNQSTNNIIPWAVIRNENDFSPNPYSNDAVYGQDHWSCIAANAKKGYVKIQVSDNGCGMSNELLSKLFNMFDQTNDSIVDRCGMTGYGLWTSKYLCDRMNGGISVYSKEGKGTTLVFYIPVKVGSLVEDHHRRMKLSAQFRVLVVDDDNFVRNLHRTILEQEGVQTTFATNGIEGLKEYLRYPDGYFDLIMMDVNMPEMDGFTAVKKIREFESENEWRHVDICIVSGEFYDENEIWAKLKAKVGSSNVSQIRCMKKPIDANVVKKMVRDIKKEKGELLRLNS